MRPLGEQARRFAFYATNTLQWLIPDWRYRNLLAKRLAGLSAASLAEMMGRVDYYLQLDRPFEVPERALRARDIRSDGYTTYYFDLLSILRYFPAQMRVSHLFGDVRDVPSVPTVVKSRPLDEPNHNSVLLKLNQLRHYYFATDNRSFAEKLDVVVWRGKCQGRPNRIDFVERFHATSGCDIGDVNPKVEGKPTWKPYMTITDQLRHKFILSIEGNDVATNTKWIMASNSLCFMARPRFETWFMEGRLIPDHHYVLLRDDYADLLEKRHYYMSHPAEALAIIANAHQHVAQFRDRSREELIGILVLRKYFRLSGQWPEGLP